MATIQRAFRLPSDVINVLESKANATEYLVQAIREKAEREEIERFRASARRIASQTENLDVEFALAAQAEVVLGE